MTASAVERVAAPVTGRWPNLFVVGAAKAGTTSLWRHLGAHPDVHMSPAKEPHFFSPAETMEFRKVHDADAYLRLFAGARGERYLGEASPAYLWDPAAPPGIHERVPDARILIMLRDPVERAYSAYRHAVRATERRTFAEVVEAELGAPGDTPSYCVGRSFYAESVERYLETFGDRVRIGFFEELARDPHAELRAVLEFLELDTSPADSPAVEEAANAAAVPRNALVRTLLGSPAARRAARLAVPLAFQPRVETWLLRPAPGSPVEPGLRERLRALYRPDVERLGALLQRPLPW